MPSLYIIFQLILVGLIVILSAFYIWRTLSALRSEVEELRKSVINLHKATATATAAASASPSSCCPMTPTIKIGNLNIPATGGTILDDDDEEIYLEDVDEDEDEDEDDCDVDVDEDDYDVNEDDIDVDDSGKENSIEIALDENGLQFFKAMSFGNNQQPPTSSVHISEIEEDDESHTQSQYSKNKLNKMHVDEIREILAEKKLSTEGPKKVLIQRIIDSINATNA